jgi:hypothetical protein
MASTPFDLSAVRREVNAYLAALQDRDGPVGCYRSALRRRPDLYASLDAALMRVIMGEDLRRSLSDDARAQWIDHINSFARRNFERGADGSYEDTYGHSSLHATGMVIGALGTLGGRQAYPVRLYDDFDTAEKLVRWLEALDWSEQWRASHLFWGGLHCLSFSRACTPAWRDAAFAWLDDAIDGRTGWWRAGVPHADRHQPLGGSVHILPMYEHHGRTFPYPERLIDSVLALQLPNGRWLDRPDPHVMHYLELDALYALKLSRTLAPGHRSDAIDSALDVYGAVVREYWENRRHDLFRLHPHIVLAAVGTFGLLQQHRPDAYRDDVAWTDIFTDRRFYRTDAVELLPEADAREERRT